MIEFAALPMLVSLVAAAIPYLLLRNRVRSRQTIYWSANRLLEEAVKTQARKMDWLRWLLLALRTLALIALAIAVANPFWLSSSSITSNPKAGSTLYCFVVDCSASMSLQISDEANAPTRLDQSVEKIRSELSRLNNYDMVAIVVSGHLTEVRFIGDRSNSAAIERILSGITASPMSVDTNGIAASIQQVFEQAKTRSNSIRQAVVQIYSDFSEKDWSLEQLQDLKKQLAGAASNLPTQLTFERHELDTLGATPIRNLTLCSLEYTDQEATSGSWVVQIKNTGSQTSSPTAVQLWIDNHLEKSSEIGTLSASQSGSIEFIVARHAVRDQLVEIRLPRDQLLLDNVGFYALEHALPQSTVLVGSDSSATVGLESAYQSFGIVVQNFTSFDSIERNDTPQDIHLVDPSAISETLLNRITDLAGEDNDVFVWLGGSLPAGTLNEISSSEHVPSKVFSLADWETNDLATITAQARNEQGGSSINYNMPLSKYWRVAELRDGWQSVLSLENGDPFAMRKMVGRGSVTWIVTPPTLAIDDVDSQLWNAMARWPTFIPLVDFLRRSANQAMRRNYLVGETVTWNSPERVPLSIERPDGSIAVEHSSNRPEHRFVADRLGWYKILSKENAVPIALSANLDCNEIDFTASQVPQAMHLNGDSPTDGERAAVAKHSIFRMLLMCSIAFLVSETIVTAIAASRRF